MPYFSTNRQSPNATFREAVLCGQPGDKGLYFPTAVPELSPRLHSDLGSMSNDEIAFEAIRPFVDGEIDDDTLRRICSETVNFDIPLVPLSDRISVLELFHGPTMAFKDVGAKFMSRCLGHFSADADKKTVVIVATSGDTGSAVAAGFHGVEAVDVVILYPKGKVSRVQELQLTTMGGNVTTLELHGTFDDCQTIAKKALADADLRGKANFTSANSINVARWLPQQFYYLFAAKQWQSEPQTISVPSGNFGNLAAGMLASRSGLQVSKFIAACNANDVVPRFFRDGIYEPRPSVPTISNAMDVGAPSNWVRILEMFAGDLDKLAEAMTAVSVTDDETRQTIREVSEEHGYILDPHAAVGYKALDDSGERGIVLGTAHPVKFDVVSEILGVQVPVPPLVRELELKQKQSIEVDNDYDQVKEVVLARI